MKLKLLEADDIVVAVQGWRGGHGNSNTLRVLLPPSRPETNFRSCKFPNLSKLEWN
jgi:hypothetical protein